MIKEAIAFGGMIVAAVYRPLEEITEIRADSPDLPEALRPAVEAFVNGQNGDLADYTVAYRASELDGDAADILILPKWEKGGVLEDYARQYGGDSAIDLAAPTAYSGDTHRVITEHATEIHDLREQLAAIGARTETCRHGYDYASVCNLGCDDQVQPIK